MSQNVSQYLHMMENCHIKENYIKWAINLRTNEPIKGNQVKEVAVPDVYFKKTKLSQMKMNKDSDKRNNFNTADFIQFLAKNEQFSYFNESCLNYVTSLRAYSSSKKEQGEKERFSSIAFKNKNKYPNFLKKVYFPIFQDFIRKTKAVKEDDK